MLLSTARSCGGTRMMNPEARSAPWQHPAHRELTRSPGGRTTMIRTLLLRRFPVAIALTLALGLTACSPSGAPAGQTGAQTIKIVSSLPRTGASKGQTDTIVNSINMALAEVNNKVGNFNIVYEDLDDATA